MLPGFHEVYVYPAGTVRLRRMEYISACVRPSSLKRCISFNRVVETKEVGVSATTSSPVPVTKAHIPDNITFVSHICYHLQLGVSIATSAFFPNAAYLDRQLALSWRTVKGLVLPVQRRELNSPLEVNPEK